MAYIGTDQRQGHLFRCPPQGCRLKNRISRRRYCATEHYEKPTGDWDLLLGALFLFPRVLMLS